MAIVAETCPVLHLNQSQPYVVALSPRHFSVYLPEENTARVTCGEDFLGSMTMPAGLSEVTVDPLCAKWPCPERKGGAALRVFSRRRCWRERRVGKKLPVLITVQARLTPFPTSTFTPPGLRAAAALFEAEPSFRALLRAAAGG